MTDVELNEVVGGAAKDYVGPCETYVVKKGDTLSGIAKKYNTTVGILCRLNSNLITDENFIRTGWKILVPKKK